MCALIETSHAAAGAAPYPPAAAEAEYDRGATLAAEGKLVEAKAAFRSALAIDPRYSSASAVLAFVEDAEANRIPDSVVTLTVGEFVPPPDVTEPPPPDTTSPGVTTPTP